MLPWYGCYCSLDNCLCAEQALKCCAAQDIKTYVRGAIRRFSSPNIGESCLT